MSLSRTLAVLLLASPAWALDGYIVGGGVEADSEDGIAASMFAELGLSTDTWLSAAIASNQADLPRGITIDTFYADVGIDHWFQPVGVRAGIAYWGDNEILDSVDFRSSLYWRNDRVSLAANYERREFSFDIFRDAVSSGQDVEFHANGVGLSGRFELNDSIDFSFSGIDYEYNVDLGRAANRPIADFLSISRLSLLNSLVDYRARISLGIDAGPRRWTLDFAKWEGIVDGRPTDSVTLRFLTPIGQRNDIEISLGVDHADGFGSVTLLSVFLFFYG